MRSICANNLDVVDNAKRSFLCEGFVAVIILLCFGSSSEALGELMQHLILLLLQCFGDVFFVDVQGRGRHEQDVYCGV